MAAPLRTAVIAALAVPALSLCESVARYLATVDYTAEHAVTRFASGAAGPEQARLSLTGDASEMFITFVEPDAAPCESATVAVAPAAGGAGAAVFTTAKSSYTAGVIGWNGTIYTARATGLTPGAAYTYTITSCGAATAPAAFKAAPTPSADASVLVGVLADMGTVIPLGFAVAEQLTKDNAGERFDMTMLAGDIACASPERVGARGRGRVVGRGRQAAHWCAQSSRSMGAPFTSRSHPAFNYLRRCDCRPAEGRVRGRVGRVWPHVRAVQQGHSIHAERRVRAVSHTV